MNLVDLCLITCVMMSLHPSNFRAFITFFLLGAAAVVSGVVCLIPGTWCIFVLPAFLLIFLFINIYSVVVYILKYVSCEVDRLHVF